MKILICTQVVDSKDSNLGFFHRWIEEFAAHCEQVIVICLRKGSYSLPPNVIVLSLGKEVGTLRLVRMFLFLQYIFKYRNLYDSVFVHMNPEYVLLGGYFWRKWKKKVGLWYAHKSATRKLSHAVLLVDKIFTVAQNSFPIATPKLAPLGHGIDTEIFKPQIHASSTQLRILTVGRIAESKHIIEMLETLDVLHAQGERFVFTIVGIPTSSVEECYALKLQYEIGRRSYSDRIFLMGAVPHSQLPEILNNQDIFFNFGTTGNMDKAGLEPLSCGVPVLTTNANFQELLSPYGLYVATMSGKVVAQALIQFLSRNDRPAIVAALRNKVNADHSLTKLIPKILVALQQAKLEF